MSLRQTASQNPRNYASFGLGQSQGFFKLPGMTIGKDSFGESTSLFTMAL